MVRSIFFAGLGGFIGTALRFLLTRFIQESSNSLFPWPTLMINIAGCLLIGIIMGVSEKDDFLSPDLRLFLTVGICGGFTTFSSFSNDSFLLLRDKEWLLFSLYTSFSFFFCILAAYMGRIISKII
jgi:fluoride exporter